MAKPVPGRPQKLTSEQTRQVFVWVTGNNPPLLAFAFALDPGHGSAG